MDPKLITRQAESNLQREEVFPVQEQQISSYAPGSDRPAILVFSELIEESAPGCTPAVFIP